VWLRISHEGKIADGTRRELDARNRFHYEPPLPRYPADIVAPLPQNKIMAIKEYRSRVGAGLADSKMAVERIMEELGMGPATTSAAPHALRATTRWCNA
jgi:hypothetical protein